MSEPRRRFPLSSLVGLALAGAVICAWLALHVFAVWHLDAPASPVLALLCLIGLTWLSVGLFIVAHDAMHGAIVAGRPGINKGLGSLALLLFAGFSWRKLIVKHMAHHRHAGTDDDPDFSRGGPLSWYIDFVRTYFGWREFWVLGGSVILYALILGPRWAYVTFWAVPSILASMQLFVFGTWLPHRPDHDAFPDRHNARSTRFGRPLSLLTCFHFGGYHHEHHLYPSVPWWQLPSTRGKDER
ncbi:fatty acid desaturase [Paracoccus aerius]|uniref:Fatty acid desaturase n=1 Tax=Paracoccus aerius TaxID=1915382 RepID=A0ABS1S9B0_9RHOB|nr:fatty acid desaturase [Paracoccus aerius]MBL3675150.1 fatty acid desaturase [Paracoccus aerius]GHG30548.1 beta-carotene ketolase [Paracoccus aerius]